jgi:hypothetical protein
LLPEQASTLTAEHSNAYDRPRSIRALSFVTTSGPQPAFRNKIASETDIEVAGNE